MKKLLSIVTCVFLAGCTSSVSRNEPAANELRQTLVKGIVLLEAEQYYKYDHLLIIRPDHRNAENLKDERIYNESFGRGWNDRTTKETIRDLKLLISKTPEFSQDGSVATFTIPKELDPQRKGYAQLEKVDGKWYFITN